MFFTGSRWVAFKIMINKNCSILIYMLQNIALFWCAIFHRPWRLLKWIPIQRHLKLRNKKQKNDIERRNQINWYYIGYFVASVKCRSNNKCGKIGGIDQLCASSKKHFEWISLESASSMACTCECDLAHFIVCPFIKQDIQLHVRICYNP